MFTSADTVDFVILSNREDCVVLMLDGFYYCTILRDCSRTSYVSLRFYLFWLGHLRFYYFFPN